MIAVEDEQPELRDVARLDEAESEAQAPRKTVPYLSDVVTYLATFVATVAAWWLVKLIFHEPDYVLPSPIAVVRQLGSFHALFIDNTWATLKEVLLGFVLASVIGILGGALVAYSRLAERTLYPAVVAAQSVPKIALAPLFIIWFGFGPLPKIVMAALLAFFPILINVTAGLKEVDPALVMMARATGASKGRIFYRIQLPLAAPNVFTGLKLGITLATTGAIVGEFISGNSGLGSIVEAAQGQQQADIAFGGIVLLSLISVLLFYVIVGIESIVVKGRK